MIEKQVLSESTAREQLEALEQRLGDDPARSLGIAEDASIVDACVAFATLADLYSPRRYLTLSPQLADRARHAHRRLQEALEHFIASRPNRPTRELLPSAIASERDGARE